jgi:glycine/D-amino acid oxidase-like deaminating enzyme
MRARVVVVGGGVMGVAIAWHCARRADALTEPVVLLEKSALAAGESGRSGAILRQHYSDRVVAAMARDSLKVYATLERNTGRSIGFQRTGVITLAGPRSPDDIALIERNIAMQREIGIDTRRVDAREIRWLVPGIAVDEGAIGAYEPDGGGVDPVRTVHALAALARGRGAITRIGVGCDEILVRDGRVSGVRTSEGDVEAEQVVVAAGPWTRGLLARAGVDVPLRVVRPEQHFVEMPVVSERSRGATVGGGDDVEERFGERSEEMEPVAHPVILDLEHGFYARCEMHASPIGLRAPRTRVGCMDHSRDAEVEDPDRVDERVGDEFKGWARGVLERRMPEYGERGDVGSMAGMYTLSPDAQAMIGEVANLRGVFVVSGFSGHGFKLAPSIGEGVAQMLWGEPVSAFDTAFFAVGRFDAGVVRWGRAFGL